MKKKFGPLSVTLFALALMFASCKKKEEAPRTTSISSSARTNATTTGERC